MADPWQHAKYDLYLAIFTTATQLYELPVWPRESAEKPAETDGHAGDLTAMTRRLAFLAPAPVAAAAASVIDGAHQFAAVIEELRRDTTGRPVRGILLGPLKDRFDSAQREFGAHVDKFAVLAREDLGITGDYLHLAPAPGR